MRLHTSLPPGNPTDGQYVPLDIVSDTVAVDAAEFRLRHAQLRERVVALSEMADDLAKHLEEVEEEIDEKAAPLYELREDDEVRPIDAREFLSFIATMSHATDVARDAFYDCIATAYGAYLIPVYVIEGVADRNRVTMSRTVLSNVERVDERKFLRAPGWRGEEIPDHLAHVREYYGMAGGRSFTSRERASRDNTPPKTTTPDIKE